MKVINGELCNHRQPAIIDSEETVIEYYSALKIMRDRFKDGILKRDIHEKWKKSLERR